MNTATPFHDAYTEAQALQGKRSPWGIIDYVQYIALGITHVATPGHGGFKLNRSMNAKMPKEYRREGGWYEEDCEWALVVLTFPIYFTDEQVAQAERSAKNYFPHEYMAVTGETLTPKDSYILEEEAFNRDNYNNWVVVSAVNSTKRPGYVECMATLGGRGRRETYNNPRYFYVLSERYQARNLNGYIIQPDDEEMVGS